MSVYLGFDEVNWARMRKFATQTIFTVLRDEQKTFCCRRGGNRCHDDVGPRGAGATVEEGV